MTSHQTQDVRPQPQADPRRWAGLAVLAGSLLVVVMDMTILNVAVPALAADLRPSSTQLLWIVDSYSLVIAGLLVTVAALGDRLLDRGGAGLVGADMQPQRPARRHQPVPRRLPTPSRSRSGRHQSSLARYHATVLRSPSSTVTEGRQPSSARMRDGSMA